MKICKKVLSLIVVLIFTNGTVEFQEDIFGSYTYSKTSCVGGEKFVFDIQYGSIKVFFTTANVGYPTIEKQLAIILSGFQAGKHVHLLNKHGDRDPLSPCLCFAGVLSKKLMIERKNCVF